MYTNARRFFLAVISLASLLLHAGFIRAATAPKVEELYTKNCAACHGTEMEGGLGPSLVKGYWLHGSSDEDLTRDINEGFPDLGMPAWEQTIPPDQVRALVIYLREREQTEAAKKIVAPKPHPNQPVMTKYQTYKLETLTNGLKNPWGLAFLPDGRMLVTDKSGPVRIVSADGKQISDPIQGTPPVMNHGQGGMMAVGLHPDYATNGWVYLGFADGWRDEKNQVKTITAVVRGHIKDNAWVDQEWIYRPDKQFYTGAGVHFGTRFVFDKNYVYFVVGERGGGLQAQDIKRPNGKIFRLFDDGKVPPDNPFVGQAGAEEGIWSYGHRNPQGLTIDPRDGSIWETEHGPRGGDEFNHILRGRNYGWPVITYGMDYDGRPMPGSEGTAKEGMEQPVKYWTPSIATCGLTFYGGDKFPNWKNDFFAGSLKAGELHRLRVVDGKLTEDEVVLSGMGRIRAVETSPDGMLYILLNNPDVLARLVPAEPAPQVSAHVDAPTTQ